MKWPMSQYIMQTHQIKIMFSTTSMTRCKICMTERYTSLVYLLTDMFIYVYQQRTTTDMAQGSCYIQTLQKYSVYTKNITYQLQADQVFVGVNDQNIKYIRLDDATSNGFKYQTVRKMLLERFLREFFILFANSPTFVSTYHFMKSGMGIQVS
ncbi:Hypothetical_protein [Hexamita inflata]|uniref:Hypothetical_protein n=1 Tax=Hexamita inflata TaxID=28002 RepID=A0AA86PSZ8_9EUKA|nr:Hypothetical protein HINF_LOCUS31272 [Hexamita inflata]